MRILVPFLALLLSLQLSALEFEYMSYDWEENPVIHELSEDEQNHPAVYIKDDRAVQYLYGDNEDLEQFYIEHKIIHVNDDAAIEEYNKVFIPMHNVEDLIELKARSIAPDGTVMEVTRENIKELSNLENAGAYKLFAIEGLQKGGELEYFYKLKKYPRYFGREIFQSETPVRDATFILLSPSNLLFEMMGYNGFPDGLDTVIDENRVHQSAIRNIDALYTEKYASYTANLMRVEYKLAFNMFSGRGRLLTWQDAAERYDAMIYQFEKEDIKSAAKIIDDLKLDKISSVDEKIIELEKFIKTDITLQEGAGDEFEKPSRVLENNYANEFGFLKLMGLFLTQLDIDHNLILTTNRYKYRFDGTFDTWNYLDEAFFYFAHSDKYLVPHQYEYRYGLIPHEFIDNEALFITPSDALAETRVEVEVKKIPTVEVKNHFDDLLVKVSFTDDLTASIMNVKRTMAGYRASFIQPYFDLLPEETRVEFVEAILKSSGEDASIKSSNVLNHSEEDIYKEMPFIIEGEMETSSWIERAGNKYLFKVGEVIGAQVEMYQDRPRQFDVEFEYPHKYLRVISIDKPEGFQFKGLDDINIDIRYDDEDGEPAYGFLSTYREEGDQLIITINEYYNTAYFPRDEFEQFRQVINAAADFNKVTVILEKI